MVLDLRGGLGMRGVGQARHGVGAESGHLVEGFRGARVLSRAVPLDVGTWGWML